MVGVVLAVALASIVIRLLCYNPMFGAEVNDGAKKLFGG
jgi:hypothetical protein